MCGIIAYNGQDDAIPYLLEGIRNLEYRGYDSFGCAIDSKVGIIIKKDIGKVDDVINKYKIQDFSSSKAIFHTRWATHGGIKAENAHPMVDCTHRIAVAHNGIIENWAELKESLGAHRFVSDTDTEVLSHLIEEKLNDGADIQSAVKDAFNKIKGSSSFIVLDKQSDDLIAVKKGSPLVLGIAKNGNFLSSDVPSFVRHTNKVVYLSDSDMVVLGKKNYTITNLMNRDVNHDVSTVNFSYQQAEKGDYEHFMIKEIMEQPGLMKNLESADLKNVVRAAELVKHAKQVYLMGAGTSYHAAMLGAKVLRENGINAVAVQGQDLITYRKVISAEDVFILISQSGETADIINVLPLIYKNQKIGVINSEGSTLAKDVDVLIPIGAGLEKAVASTKSFTLSGVYLTFIGMFAAGRGEEAIRDLKLMNINMYNLLVPSVLSAIDKVAEKIKGLENVFFLGRDANYITALEGALKLKEVSYIHAEAIDAATFKHGPLALISDKVYAAAVVSEVTRNDMLYNLQEVKARGGNIIGISDKNENVFDMFIRTQNGGAFTFVMHAIILQLLAYKTAMLKGLDIDHPRNLAKTVTVL